MSYKLRVIDRYSQISPNFAVRNIKVFVRNGKEKQYSSQVLLRV